MTMRRAVDGGALATMVLLCAIWGLQQVAMKAAAADMAPVLQVAIRSGIAAVPVFMLVLVRRERGHLGSGSWRAGLAVGALFALEFLLVGEGLRHTSASHMAIFLYTAPIFTALGLHFRLPEERLGTIQWTGMGLALAGVALSFSAEGAVAGAGGRATWLGDLLGIAAAAAWAATTLTIRFSRLSGAPATVTLLYQLGTAFVLLLAAALLLGRMEAFPSPTLIASLAFQTVAVSLVSFLLWFALLRVYLASRLGVLSFMTPIFGILFGMVILGEKLTTGFLLGSVLVLGGILLVSAPDLLRHKESA